MNTKKIVSRTVWARFMAMMLVVVLWSCGGNEEVGSESMISGANSKTWKADKELNAAGDKDKLSDAEKQETMQFYADGRFALGGGGELQTGTWNYDQAAKRLSLQFEGQDVTENFEVTTLKDDKMVLKASDGSTMELEAE
ncbi:lipocalin family protein [Pontibacter cellulosilyticus]|uniref:Lipocalin family protein n=1 Tax=Pontibacter cellulosilyticus TaxID=1720253 RepID=A0A923N7G3_9BACT|nr:lipocalin family protein [Pontibacter cellulosilyticus]MBC5992821.1 lipocalin family protein [Pontibacter cellulosilyticus]